MRLPRFVHDVIDFCYPGRCAACDAECDGSATLCIECGGGLARLERAARCEQCAMPLAEAGAPCPYCEGDGVPHYEQILRLTTFDDPVKHLIRRTKYHARWTLAEFFAERLWKREPVRRMLEKTDCLVPIPLHRLRQISRGYNQAEVLARALARLSGTSLARPAVRFRNTETQTGLHSRAKREENLKAAFALVDARKIAGRHVVVVDDVTTTGATLQAFARTLRPARPASLSAVVIAIADPEGRNFQTI